MRFHKLRIFSIFIWALVVEMGGGCKEAKEVRNAARMLADPRIPGPVYDRLKWKVEDFYSDPGAIALCKAIQAKNLPEIDRLVKSGVDVNAKGVGNMTPLLWAFPAGEEVFGHVLDLGADPNTKLTKDIIWAVFDKDTSVMMACAGVAIDGETHEKCFYDVKMENYLELVLKHGGNPNAENAYGQTPVFWALDWGDPHGNHETTRRVLAKKIRLLVDAGADIDHKDGVGETALSKLTVGGYCPPLTLLKAGADYRVPNRFGWDLVLSFEYRKMQYERRDKSHLTPEPAEKELFEFLSQEGVDWNVARTAIENGILKGIKDLPADYRHRPWLPQRPTLKKPKDEGN